jgi:hypothetical protein
VRCKGCARVNDVSLAPAAGGASAAAAGAAGAYVEGGGEWQRFAGEGLHTSRGGRWARAPPHRHTPT